MAIRRSCSVFLSLLLLASACGEEPSDQAQPAKDPNFAVASAGWYRGDLHTHSTYSADAKKQGGDSLAGCLAIADAYRAPEYLKAYPGRAGDGLDFVAITDHRTDASLKDPAFKHDHLVLIPAEEYGGSGHANIFGLSKHISEKPPAGVSKNDHQRAAVKAAHGQGAIFSVNHPAIGINWIWDTPAVDAVEVFNGPWTSFLAGSTLAKLESDVKSGGVENAYIRDAVVNGGVGGNDKGLRYWQNMLTAGVHVPPVGGSDRHMVAPMGIPTTYVKLPGGGKKARPTWQQITAGIKAGATFVSRSPHGPQVELTATGPDGAARPMGASLKGPGPWKITARVSRARGGILRLVAGALKVPTNGKVSAEPRVVHRANLPADDVTATFTWKPGAAGGWLHALVLEPVAPTPLPAEAQKVLDQMKTPMAADALVALALKVLPPFINSQELIQPSLCDPSAWQPWKLQCMPADKSALGSFYIPDGINRLLNIFYEGGKATDRCMGAISAAFLAR